MNIMLEVKRLAPVRTIMTRPMENMRAPDVRIGPGGYSWYHGLCWLRAGLRNWMGILLVIGLKGVREVEEPESEERAGHHGVEEGFVESKVCLFCAIRLASPTVCWGVKASIWNLLGGSLDG
jgi:hypothetical protein